MVSNLTLRPRKLTRGAGYDPLELGLLSEKQSIQGTNGTFKSSSELFWGQKWTHESWYNKHLDYVISIWMLKTVAAGKFLLNNVVIINFIRQGSESHGKTFFFFFFFGRQRMSLIFSVFLSQVLGTCYCLYSALCWFLSRTWQGICTVRTPGGWMGSNDCHSVPACWEQGWAWLRDVCSV